MRLGYRTKTFLAIFGVAAAALVCVATLVSVSLKREMYLQIERAIVSEVRLMASLLNEQEQVRSHADLDAEADRLAVDFGGRVTFIAADGTVVGDSSVATDALSGLENHARRPEVIQARRSGLGLERRYSHTIRTDMLYAAAPTRNAAIAVVRLALPLSAIDRQLAAVRNATLVALALSLAGALGLAWVSSYLLGRRVRSIAAAARRYASGDVSARAGDDRHDELGTVASVLDDTAHALTNRARELAEDRARLEAILTGMNEGVLMVDGHGRVRLLNAAVKRMLRLDDTALARHYLEAIRHPGVASLVSAALEGTALPGVELSPSRNPDRTLVARATPLAIAAGRGAVVVLHDITDLRRADLVRRDFVANVSHELRTPLTAIRGYVEALRDEAPSPADSERFLEIIGRHTERMERLVRDLLRLARLEAKQEPVERAPCSIAGVIAGAVSDLAAPIEEKRQHVEVVVEPAADHAITDASKLQDALRNIIENAVAYSPSDSTILVEAAAADDRVILTVSDRGPGIPEEDLTRIFERFYRVDKARSRESGGTGLGLSIVRHLVERLSGEVQAANRPGGGAVFTIAIPREPAAAAPV
jgi:two-component system phosphate regulon sensor histidine kinase PhoR